MPIRKNSVVLYKNNPAVVCDVEQDKYVIQFFSFALSSENILKIGSKNFSFSEQRVREKDITVLSVSENPDKYSIEEIVKYSENDFGIKIKEAWELLSSDDETCQKSICFSELASLIDSDYSDKKCWFVFNSILNSLEFSFDEKNKDGLYFIPRTENDINELSQKQNARLHEKEERAGFISRLKAKKLNSGDSIYMGDIEAFALGKTDKSKTMQEAGFTETPEKAHKLLLDTGIWDITRNPYPFRWGLSVKSASEGLASPSEEEERVRVPGVAYAIDNEGSTDPDDAVGFDGTYLWVHIADPASTVFPDSSIDRTARDRGATLYIPEGASRMLAEKSLSDYALGLKRESKALSFRLLLEDNCAIKECMVFKTIVEVECITYKKADELKDSPELKPLFEIAEKNLSRRLSQGAVEFSFPEVHISVEPETKKVSVLPDVEYKSCGVIKEMMLLAGEGAAHFAFENNIPFPYVSQEKPDLPENIPEGLAGNFKLVKSMHKRSVGVTPSVHSGLGIGMYSQVTSPLRRYSDLVAHQQLRAFLDKRELIDKNTLLERISAGDEAAVACKKVERKSDLHWTLVYLLQNPDWTGEAVFLDMKGTQGVFMIPSLAQQTLIIPSHKMEYNEVIKVKASQIDIPNLTVNFIEV